MKHNQTKKLCLAGILCAVAVVGSLFSFPVFGSKCAPVQHMVNILSKSLQEYPSLYRLGMNCAKPCPDKIL